MKARLHADRIPCATGLALGRYSLGHSQAMPRGFEHGDYGDHWPNRVELESQPRRATSNYWRDFARSYSHRSRSRLLPNDASLATWSHSGWNFSVLARANQAGRLSRTSIRADSCRRYDRLPQVCGANYYRENTNWFGVPGWDLFCRTPTYTQFERSEPVC